VKRAKSKSIIGWIKVHRQRCKNSIEYKMIRWKTAYFVPECSLFDSGEYIWGKEKQKQTSTYEEEKMNR